MTAGSKKKVFLVQGVWPFQRKSEKFEVIETTVGALEKAISTVEAGKEVNVENKLFSFIMIEYKYKNGKSALEKAKLSGCATIEQDDNSHGWGISFVSAEQALTLAKETSDRNVEKERVKEEKEKQKRAKYVKELQALPLRVRKKTVYFFIKQDYAYRGLEESFSGKLTVQDVCDLEIADLEGNFEREQNTRKRIFARFRSENIHFSFDELVGEGTAVTKLLKKKTVSASGEIGYIALSFKSVKHAKEIVSKMIVEHELDE